MAKGKHPNARPGNQSALKHGGATGVKRIQHGEALDGPARQAELQIYEELALKGRVHIVKRNAARAQAVADCYWNGVNMLMAKIEEKAESPEAAIIKITGIVRTFDSLTRAAQRGWAQVKEEERDGDGQTLEILLSQEAEDGKDAGH